MNPKTKSKTVCRAADKWPRGDHAYKSTTAITKPEAMIHTEQARNNFPDPESFPEHWQFQRASQHSAPKFTYG